MSKENIKATIDANIYANGLSLIRGDILNAVLKEMVDDYQEEGGGTLETAPIEEDGIAFVDANLNIGVLIDTDGLHAIGGGALGYREIE